MQLKQVQRVHSSGSAQRRVALPAKHTARGRRVVSVHAVAEKPAVAQFAESIGLPVEEGIFGFKPFPELWCGRLAMMGFITSIVEEAMTGQGTLQQLGLTAPSGTLLAALLVLFGTATVAGTASTAFKLTKRQMTEQDIARYKNFLGLNNNDDWMSAAAEMKSRGDFTRISNDAAAIAAVRANGTAADRVLSLDGRGAAVAAAAEAKAAGSGVLTLTKEEEAAQVASAVADMKAAAPVPAKRAAAPRLQEGAYSAAAEFAYAQEVEMRNGRWAMMGFLMAVLVEAGTGKGIIMQIIMYLKWSGLLGAASGF